MVGPWPCLPCHAARSGGGRWDVSPPFAEGANPGEQFTRDAGTPPPGLGATHLITQNEKSKTKVRRPGLYGSVWGPDICWAGLVYSLFVAVFSSFSSVRRRPGPGLVRPSARPSVCRWAGLPACWPARPAALVPARPNALARPGSAPLDSSRVRFGGVSGEKSTRGQEEADRRQLPWPCPGLPAPRMAMAWPWVVAAPRPLAAATVGHLDGDGTGDGPRVRGSATSPATPETGTLLPDDNPRAVRALRAPRLALRGSKVSPRRRRRPTATPSPWHAGGDLAEWQWWPRPPRPGPAAAKDETQHSDSWKPRPAGRCGAVSGGRPAPRCRARWWTATTARLGRLGPAGGPPTSPSSWQ